jgi:histidine ammonia-lyase
VGYLARVPIEPAEQLAFQRALLRRGAGHGPALPSEVVRGAMLLRLVGFLSARVGVSAALCSYLVDRLNDGWTPWVPSRGTASAGEVIALSHLFGTLIGEGQVLEDDGRRMPAAEALAARGAAPYEPGLKEGIALVNGAPLAPALGVRLAARARGLLDHATLAGALTLALTRGSARPYDRRIGLLKGDPAQLRVHERLEELLANREDLPQSPVSLRVLPQVHGAALEVLERLEDQLDREVRAVTDSPLFLDGEGFYPSGNFHAEALSLQLDALAIACVQVANLGEKRMRRLLDSRFSGLPDQLAAEPGIQTGLSIAIKSAAGLCVENRLLAAPASVHPLDGSAGQEDFQAHAFLAAEKLDRILDNTEIVLATELVAIRQAHHLRPVPLSPPLAEAVERVAAVVEPVRGERVLSEDIERVRELLARQR